MREITFRAWDSVVKELLPNVQNHIGPVDTAFGGLLRNDRYKIMQYTGIKDKNGTEIYEGDIVKCYVVGWNTGGLGDKYEEFTVEFKDGKFTNCRAANDDITVVGNIHEGG